jgi:hypothetical protein
MRRSDILHSVRGNMLPRASFQRAQTGGRRGTATAVARRVVVCQPLCLFRARAGGGGSSLPPPSHTPHTPHAHATRTHTHAGSGQVVPQWYPNQNCGSDWQCCGVEALEHIFARNV